MKLHEHQIKIIEHIQSRKGDRLVIEIPAKLTKVLVDTKEGELPDLFIVVGNLNRPTEEL